MPSCTVDRQRDAAHRRAPPPSRSRVLPAAQTVMRPNCPWSWRASSFTSVVVIRAPVAPNGWPTAIEPPITLSRARSTAPSTAARTPAAVGPGTATRVPEDSRAPARRTPSACISTEIDVSSASSPARRAPRRYGGEHRRLQQLLARIDRRAGRRLPDVRDRGEAEAPFARSSLISSTAAPPSVSGDASPAVDSSRTCDRTPA